MRSPYRVTPDLARKFLADYRKGLSYRQLAKKYDCSKGTIEWWIGKARIAGFAMRHRPATALDAFLMVKAENDNGHGD